MALTTPYPSCPLCGANGPIPVGTFDCTAHALYVPALPGTLTWVRCGGCGHVHTDRYWTPEGLKVLFAKANPSQLAGTEFEEKRYWWAPVVRNVLAHLGAGATHDGLGVWLDAGCGDGSLVMTAAEFGFDAIGLDSRTQAVARITGLGYRAVEGDFLHSAADRPVAVVSMADVLEHIPYPPEALRKAHAMLRAGGALYVSCPNMDCAPWRAMDAARMNPYWMEIEHHHNFTRRRLVQLLEQCGFRPVSYDISPRYKAGMEIISLKADAP